MTRLMFESHFMPFVTPESTEASTNTEMTRMMMTCVVALGWAMSATSRPELICRTPRPREVATPNSVPTRAMMSIV